jgi:isocitrate/isopropylmalate dehydrogenase
MLLRHVDKGDRASAIESAVDTVLERGDVRTPDLGGGSTTHEVAEAIAAEVTV